jgi:hypothetical protein
MLVYLAVLVGSLGLVDFKRAENIYSIQVEYLWAIIWFEDDRNGRILFTNKRMNEVYIFKFWLVKMVREHIEGLFR